MTDYTRRAMTYRERAEEMESLAETVRTDEAKKTFLLVAADYLEMAQMMERLSGGDGVRSGAEFKR